MVLAQPGPGSITDRVTDTAGVLSSAEISQLEEQIQALQAERQQLLYIVLYNGDGQANSSYAQQIVATRGANTAAFVVDVAGRQAAVSVGAEWSGSDEDSLYEAAYQYLAADDWAGAAGAVAAEADGSGSGSGSGSGDGGGLWLGAGGAAVVAAGGGIAWASRRRNKKDQAAQVDSARGIDPADRPALARQSLETLAALAAEELVSTDESIRRGKEELELAVAEFGPERTRKFTAAMNHSTTTLQKAFALQQQLHAQGASLPEAQRRQMLVDIVSSCGQADDALDAQAQEFAQLRNLLVQAPERLDELTQKVVDLRARLPRAGVTLEQLRADYPAPTLRSIADNVELAEAAVAEADKSLTQARAAEARPAGQQGGLVDAIRATEHALEVADRLVGGVENAAANIATARAGLDDLIAEVDGEITEARQIEAQGTAQGTQADWDALEELLTRAGQATESARANGGEDPLGEYTALMAIDTELDAALDSVREVTQTHAEQLRLFAQQISVAASAIQAAEDLISSRGQLIGAGARTALADASRLHAQALHLRDRDIRAALEAARQAAAAARAAQERAEDDIDNYRRRMQRQQAADSAGNIITGMVIGSMLGGGNRGGFGGGFGGGSFGGGGGFGGGTRGGAF